MHEVDVTTRQQIVLQAFAARSGKGSDSPGSTSPFAVLVKKLQESLTRIENFEVVTVSPGAEGECLSILSPKVTHSALFISISPQLCFNARTPTSPSYRCRGWYGRSTFLLKYCCLHPCHRDLPSTE